MNSESQQVTSVWLISSWHYKDIPSKVNLTRKVPHYIIYSLLHDHDRCYVVVTAVSMSALTAPIQLRCYQIKSVGLTHRL